MVCNNGKQLVFDTLTNGDVGRFIKHSPNPNVTLSMTFVKAHDDRVYQVPIFYALTDIAPNTILSRNYGDSYLSSVPWF